MSRYIDADVLEYDTEWSEYHDGFTAYSQMAIDTAPSIDIVRCNECKHWQADWNPEEGVDNFHFCPMVERSIFGDWFCADGEREGE